MSKAPRSAAKPAASAEPAAVEPAAAPPAEAAPVLATIEPEPAPVETPSVAATPVEVEKSVPAAAAFSAAPLRNLAVRYGAPAAAVAVALGLGYGLARAVPQADQAQLFETTAGVRETRQTLARLSEDVQVLKGSLDGIKNGLDRPQEAAKLTQTVDRLAKDSADKAVRLGEQIERIERAQRDPARLSAVTERLDRMEKQIAAAAPKPAPVPAPAAAPLASSSKSGVTVAGADPVASTGSVAKPERVAGWVLREAGEGGALVESESGRIREVYPGQSLPGGLRILSVERRGRQWVVVTSKGLITPN